MFTTVLSPLMALAGVHAATAAAAARGAGEPTATANDNATEGPVQSGVPAVVAHDPLGDYFERVGEGIVIRDGVVVFPDDSRVDTQIDEFLRTSPKALSAIVGEDMARTSGANSLAEVQLALAGLPTMSSSRLKLFLREGIRRGFVGGISAGSAAALLGGMFGFGVGMGAENNTTIRLAVSFAVATGAFSGGVLSQGMLSGNRSDGGAIGGSLAGAVAGASITIIAMIMASLGITEFAPYAWLGLGGISASTLISVGVEGVRGLRKIGPELLALQNAIARYSALGPEERRAIVSQNPALALDYYEIYLPGLLNARITELTNERTKVGAKIAELQRHRTQVAEHEGIGEMARRTELLALDRNITRLQGTEGGNRQFSGGILQGLDGDIQATRRILDDLATETKPIRDAIARLAQRQAGQTVLAASQQARGEAAQAIKDAEATLVEARREITAAFAGAIAVAREAIMRTQLEIHHIDADAELSSVLAPTSP